MKSTVKEIKPREKESIRNAVLNCLDKNMTKNETLRAVMHRMIALNIVENGGAWNALLATAESFYTVEKSRRDGVPAHELLAQYAAWKIMESRKVNDYGAFGDLLEVATRLILKGQFALMSYNDLHVQKGSKTDITARNIRFELGHNGKTFADSTPDNWVDGPFDGVIYGVFDEMEVQEIYNAASVNDYMKVAELISNCLYVWQEKEDFLSFMLNVGKRSAMITWKATARRAQVVYNPSMHSAFIKAAEDNACTLREWIKRNYTRNNFIK